MTEEQSNTSKKAQDDVLDYITNNNPTTYGELKKQFGAEFSGGFLDEDKITLVSILIELKNKRNVDFTGDLDEKTVIRRVKPAL